MEKVPPDSDASLPDNSQRASVMSKLSWLVVAFIIAAVVAFAIIQRNSDIEKPSSQNKDVIPTPTLPEIDWTDADPAVKDAIENELENVRNAMTSSKAWGTLGMILYAHGFNDQAAASFEAAMYYEDQDNKDARWPYLAASSVVEHDPRKAVVQFKKAIAIESKYIQSIRLRLAELLVEENDLSEAMALFSAVSEDDDAYPRASLGLGRIALMTDNLSRAERLLTIALRDRRAAHEARLLLSQVCLRNGDIKQAETHRSASETVPKGSWPDPITQQAMAYRTGLKAMLIKSANLFAENRITDSIALLSETTREYPDAEWGWILLGRSLIRAGLQEEARKALARSLELSPNSVEAMFRMAVAYAKDKRHTESVAWLRKALAIKPDFGMAHYNLGVATMELKKHMDSLDAFTNAVRFMPNHFHSNALLGNAHALAGNDDEALNYLLKANKLKPNDPWLMPRLEAVKRRRSQR